MGISRLKKNRFLEQISKVFTGNDTIKTSNQYVDDASRDAFGNLRTSEAKTLFDTQFQYSTFEGTEWGKKTSGTTTLTHLPDESSVELKVGTDDGDTFIWQSKRYIRYQPGKSQKIMMSSVFGESKAGVIKRKGYFDAENGIFFEQNSDTVYMVIRSKTSGSVVENRVEQSKWNYDRMDGTGHSGVNLDSSKAQIFFIDLEWLSVGRVRVGFVIDGVVRYVHRFNHANNLTGPYMSTANLPIRYEISNISDTSSETSIKAICCSVQSESGFIETRYFPNAISSGTTPVAVTNRRPVLSIRPKANFMGQVNRGDINPLNTILTASSQDCFVEVVLGGTLSGGDGVWDSVNDDSIVEYNIDSLAITGGKVIESFYVITGQGATKGTSDFTVNTRVPITLDIDGLNPINLSIVVTSLSGTAGVFSVINWREIY